MGGWMLLHIAPVYHHHHHASFTSTCQIFLG